jgi:DNA-binding transcriptional LysR family regulator
MCAAYPVALPGHSLAVRSVIDHAIESLDIRVHAVMESNSMEVLKCYCRAGHALMLSFFLGSHEESQGLCAKPLVDPVCRDGRLYLACRRGRTLPGAADSFAKELQSGLMPIVGKPA